AVTVTNPAEVVKVRLQLQGERQAIALAAGGIQKPAGNAFATFASVAKNEGLSGIQRGLGAAYVYQILLNGFRLGFYDPIKKGVTGGMEAVNIQSTVVASMASGALSGVLGAFLASPFFLVKTRMQAYTKGSTATSVGFQHSYVSKGIWHSLKTIFRDGGLQGLWRGSDASMLRTGAGSAVQLPSYEMFKKLFVAEKLLQENTRRSGLIVCTVMNPFDVAMTRMYNQKDGKAYKNVFDCIAKTIRYEGPTALYKGYLAHFLRYGDALTSRIGPHTILTLVLLDETRALLGVK
ncbi:Mitochondrial oxaloacetate carrier protein, partial [Kappamyces sp. JEL0680]